MSNKNMPEILTNEMMSNTMLVDMRLLLGTLHVALSLPDWNKESFLSSIQCEIDTIDCELMGRGVSLET